MQSNLRPKIALIEHGNQPSRRAEAQCWWRPYVQLVSRPTNERYQRNTAQYVSAVLKSAEQKELSLPHSVGESETR